MNNSVPSRRASSEGSSGGSEERGQRKGLEGRARGGREESLFEGTELCGPVGFEGEGMDSGLISVA